MYQAYHYDISDNNKGSPSIKFKPSCSDRSEPSSDVNELLESSNDKSIITSNTIVNAISQRGTKVRKERNDTTTYIQNNKLTKDNLRKYSSRKRLFLQI